VIWNRAAETMERDELEALQLERLREVVVRCSGDVRLYRETLPHGAGRALGSLADLQHLPFTTKPQLREGYPFGMLAVPRERLARIHASSGTKGKPTVVGYTRADLDLWAEVCARALVAGGAQRGDVVHNAYGYGLFTGGLGLHYGAERMGATVVPASGGNTPRQVLLIADFSARILCCTPSYALNIADTMAAGGTDPRENPLAYGIFGAEPWTDGLRAEIERRLGVQALDIYGLSEIIGPGVASECTEQAGAHVNEDHFLVEVVDPDTGEVLPDGVRGELVFTTLTREATPVLRYRTGDLASVVREPCACGRTLARMSRVTGRTDDMLVVRGVNVFPSEVEAALLEVDGLAPHYQLRLERPGALDVLRVDVEAASADLDRELLAAAAARRLDRALGLGCEVRVLDEGQVPRSEGKALRVVDARGPA
jgi:phenylacetate-CoA ligase